MVETRMEKLQRENKQLTEELNQMADRCGKLEEEKQLKTFRELAPFHIKKYMADLANALLSIRRIKTIQKHKKLQLSTGVIVEVFPTGDYKANTEKPDYWLKEEIMGLNASIYQALANIEEIKVTLKAYMKDEDIDAMVENACDKLGVNLDELEI